MVVGLRQIFCQHQPAFQITFSYRVEDWSYISHHYLDELFSLVEGVFFGISGDVLDNLEAK